MNPDPRRQGDFYRHIVDNLSTVVLVLDRALHIEHVNPAGEMLLAASARHLCGQRLDALLSDAASLIGPLREAAASGQPFTKRELRLGLPDQRQVTIDCTVTPVGEGPLGAGLVVEILPMDRLLRISREEHLIAQHQAARALVRGLAHEIKNPLGGLRGAAQLLERELDDAALREYTQVIIGEADRLRNLVNRMLGPNTLPQMRPVNIHEVLERVRNLVAAEVPAGVQIRCDYDPSIPELLADPEQLIQAALNIVRNAAQAVGETGEIVLRTRTQRQFTIGQTRHKLVLRIDVIDDGPGIDPEMLEHIFYPMVTGRAEGTGLGLSIAQSLISQHNGLIECSSVPGRTKFSLLLPLERPAKEPLQR